MICSSSIEIADEIVSAGANALRGRVFGLCLTSAERRHLRRCAQAALPVPQGPALDPARLFLPFDPIVISFYVYRIRSGIYDKFYEDEYLTSH